MIGVKYANESAMNIWYSTEPFHVEMCALSLAHSAILDGQVSLFVAFPKSMCRGRCGAVRSVRDSVE